MKKNLPDFTFEKEFWNRGIKLLGGLDEVGRGALAGPVVASCVVFSPEFKIRFPDKIIINDSKKLTPKQRLYASDWIKTYSTYFGVGEASVNEINKYGIVKATNKAFRRAVKATNINLEALLIDAFNIPRFFKSRQKAIIRGDSLSLSIASASIIAKVYRDELMTKLSNNKRYKNYNWDKNKGYGTLSHRNALKTNGITKYHRSLFIRNIDF